MYLHELDFVVKEKENNGNDNNNPNKNVLIPNLAENMDIEPIVLINIIGIEKNKWKNHIEIGTKNNTIPG